MIAAPPEASALDQSFADAPEPPPGPPRWHLRVNGLESGPVTWDVLRRLAGSGELKSTDDVRRTDQTRWVPASEARCPEVSATRSAASVAAVSCRPAVPTARPAIRRDEPEASATDPLARQNSVADASGSSSRGRPDAPVCLPETCPPATPGRHAGAALLALGLSLAGLLAFALPLGMLAVYLGGTSAAGLAKVPGGRLRLAVPLLAVAVGLADVGISLRVLSGRLCDLGGQIASAAG